MSIHSLNDERARRAGHRTQEEIMRQLEARYAELETEAAKPGMRFPCMSCRHSQSVTSLRDVGWCCHPLVMGFGPKVFMSSVCGDPIEHKCLPELCGPEKALWEPRRWQRFLSWIDSILNNGRG